MKIKVLSISAAIILFGIIGCKKNETVEPIVEDPTPGNGGQTTEVIPDNFIRRVIAEEMTGEWCSACPGGAATLENIINSNDHKVIGVAVHGGDPFQTSQSGYLDNATYRYNIQYYPSAVIDRKHGTSYTSNTWTSNVNTALTETAKCGIKLETSVNNGILDITATVVANEVLSNAYITVYLVENNVPESSSNAQAGAAAGFIHQHLLRKVISANGNGNGDDLNISETRKEYSKTYTGIDISNYKLQDLKVVALVNDFVFVPAQHRAYNAKEVSAGENTDWN
jgi:hypothetical protein